MDLGLFIENSPPLCFYFIEYLTSQPQLCWILLIPNRMSEAVVYSQIYSQKTANSKALW